jgi:hypothetical protein
MPPWWALWLVSCTLDNVSIRITDPHTAAWINVASCLIKLPLIARGVDPDIHDARLADGQEQDIGQAPIDRTPGCGEWALMSEFDGSLMPRSQSTHS